MDEKSKTFIVLIEVEAVEIDRQPHRYIR